MVSRISLLLALGISVAGSGCVQNPALPTAPPPQPKPKIQPQPVITNAAPKTKRPPKAVTYTAWAELRERDAEEKGVDPSRKMDFYDEARQAYQKALKTDAKYLPAYSGLARVYMKMNHYDRALEVYRQATEKFPKEFTLWFDMGMCQCRSKQWDQAATSFKKALEIDPENRQVTQTLGFCLARAGHIEESLAMLQRVMTPAQAHYQIARMLHHVQRDDLCRDELRQALQLDPELAPARTLLVSLDGPPPGAGNVSPPPANTAASQPQAQIRFEE